MIYYAENENFVLGVKEMGAELTSLKSKKTGFEFIWNGNEEIWYGQSPILFPIIGRLLDDKYRLNGKEYTMANRVYAMAAVQLGIPKRLVFIKSQQPRGEAQEKDQICMINPTLKNTN